MTSNHRPKRGEISQADWYSDLGREKQEREAFKELEEALDE